MKVLEKYNLIEFRGVLTKKVMTDIYNHVHVSLSDIGENRNTKRKVLICTIEIIQNIYHHSLIIKKHNKELENETSCKFEVYLNSDAYHICSMNYLNHKERESLQKLLDTINSYSKEEIKLYYRQKLMDENFSQKGGAGLGLILMAKSSGNYLNYKFEKINNDISAFYFEVNVQK